MENIFGIQMGNREKQGETETMGKNIGSGIHTSTSEKKRNSHQDISSSEVMAQILGHMGLQMKRSRTDGNQLPKSVSTEKWVLNGLLG